MMHNRLIILLAGALVAGCALEVEPDERSQNVDYYEGTIDDGYVNNGERGNIPITEVHWAGSVQGDSLDAIVHYPDDVFIELQNKMSRPMHLTGWLITIEYSRNLDTMWDGYEHAHEFTYVIPERENRQPIEPNEFVTVAARRDGAFPNADYYIDDLVIPNAPFEITLQDLDERLIDGAGDSRKPVFAGSWDLVTARSMERIQLIFNNRGNRDASWHSYSLNDFNEGDRAALHEDLRQNVAQDFRTFTFATPGMPNSPDYSGNISSGDFN